MNTTQQQSEPAYQGIVVGDKEERYNFIWFYAVEHREHTILKPDTSYSFSLSMHRCVIVIWMCLE